MSKKAVTLFLAMLLAFALLTPVCADETEIVALGNCIAGSAVDIFINKTDGGSAELSAGGISQGLEIAAESREDGTYFYLRGTPAAAGTFNFTLTYLAADGSPASEARYSLNVEAARPELSYERNISVSAGEPAAISVSASSSDGGSLSCKWFSCSGEAMMLIPDRTDFSYSPDTSKEGTYYYRFEVTNTNNSVQAATLSELICVNVGSPRLTGISISSMPLTPEYCKGDRVSTEGLKLTLTYSNGTTSEVSDGFTVSPLVLDTVGTQKITVSYKNFTCSYPVLVGEAAVKKEEIKVVSLPDKTEYAPGETISLEGLKIRVTDGSSSRDIITGFFCTPTTFYEEGRQKVTVFYGDAECTFEITVKKTAAPTPAPTPVVTPVPAATPTPAVTQTPAVITPAPSPAATPPVWSETPASQEPEEIKIPEGAVPALGDKEKETKPVSRLTVAIVVIAAVALACLGAYVYVMQNPKARRAVEGILKKLKLK